MQKLFNVGAYIRLSLKDTDYKDGSESIESQQQMLSQFISMMPGWIEKRFYIDNGFSGGNFQRPAFQEMLEDVRSGLVNLIIVKDLSRFGRNYLESGEYLEKELPALGCRFVSLLDNIDTENGENDIIPFINGLNDYYLKNLSDRIKTVLTAKVKEGQYLSGKSPYGYMRSPENHTRLIVDETAAEVVRKIYELRASGAGYYSIAHYLNKNNIIPPCLYYYNRQNREPPKNCATTWKQISVKDILNNETYTGDSVRFKFKSKSYREKIAICRDENEWIRVANTHTAIIEKDVWESVRAINQKAKEKVADYRKPQQVLFSKMLVCADCGGCFITTVKNQTRKDGSIVRYVGYQCRTKADTGNKCSWHSVSEIALKQIIFSDIKRQAEQLTLNESRMLRSIQERLIGATKRTNPVKHKHDLEQKLYTIELQNTKLYEDRCEGIISEDGFSELIASLEEKRKVIQSELDALNQSDNEKSAKLSDIQIWVKLIKEKSAIETIEDLDRELLEALIEKIEIGECEVIDGVRQRDIKVYYKFVGLI